MVLLDEPYVSEALLAYLEETKIPVLKNKFTDTKVASNLNLNIIAENNFIKLFDADEKPKLYTVSEYALGWIGENLSNDRLKHQITLLKDKVKFREACSCIYDDFCFQEISYNDLFDFDISEVKFPVVLKPSIGFLSVGVYTVTNKEEWKTVLDDIQQNFISLAKDFPENVVKDANFILESYIQGREFAIDLYFKDKRPVIINIFEHPFSSNKDVSDRLYLTNKEIFDTYLTVFTEHIARLNGVLMLDNIAVHMELRVDNDKIVPIEINPLRFAGLCLNEIHSHISGKHPLSYFFENTCPDYKTMWTGKEQKTFSFSVFERPEGAGDSILDIERIEQQFAKILEIREVDNPKLNVLAFVFSESDIWSEREINEILNIDVKQFLRKK